MTSVMVLGRRQSLCVGRRLSCPQLLGSRSTYTRGPGALPPLRCHVSGDARPQPRNRGRRRVIEQSAGHLPSAQGPSRRWGPPGLVTVVRTWLALAWHRDGAAGTVRSWGWESPSSPRTCCQTACSAQVDIFSFLSFFDCAFNSFLGLQGNSSLLLGFMYFCFLSDLRQKP